MLQNTRYTRDKYTEKINEFSSLYILYYDIAA